MSTERMHDDFFESRTMTLQVYTAPQVATLLDCSVKTVEAWARDGDLPGLKPGGGWIFPAGALATALDGLAVEQARKRKTPQKLATTPPGKPAAAKRRVLPVLVDLRSAPGPLA